MSVETDPVPPVPQHTAPIDKRAGAQERFETNWMQWFIQLRNKINIINALIVNFSQITGNGFIVLQNSINWFTRTLVQGSGISITNADGTGGDPTISHGDTSSVSDLTSNNSGTVVLQDFSITFDTFGHVQTVSVGTTDLGSVFQPLDDTLTALAGLTTAADKVPVFTGPDVVGTLTLSQGTWTPTLAAVANVTSTTAFLGQWSRVGDIVTCSVRADAVCTAAGANTRFSITLPVSSNFATLFNCVGAGTASNNAGTVLNPMVVNCDAATDLALVSFLSLGAAVNATCWITFTYRVI